MKSIEVLNQISQVNSKIIYDSPAVEMTKAELLEYIAEKKIEIDKKLIDQAINKVERIENNCAQLGIKKCCIHDKEYPYQLSTIKQPPVVLYYKGDIFKLNQKKNVAVIGTRKPTQEGERISYNLANVLSKRGYGIINGLALGCDTYAIKGSIDADVQYPVAVLAGGLDKIYPKSNEKLAEDILSKNGCLISEYEPFTEVKRYMYVQRDRIQAGLSDGVIMIEAMKESGTMHTINYAKAYDRVVACYKEKSGNFTGNQYLMEEGCLVLENNDDLQKFEDMLRRLTYYQMSLFK